MTITSTDRRARRVERRDHRNRQAIERLARDLYETRGYPIPWAYADGSTRTEFRTLALDAWHAAN